MRPRVQHTLHTNRSGRLAYVRVELAAALSDDAADDSPKWVQVTREGYFPGYMGGLKPFSFTRKDLLAMVANVRSHPSFALDAAGGPSGHVIPWDFNHASEQDPTAGVLPVSGAPAQGWTLDLEVRNNAVDGHAELWALTQFLEPARTYVRMGQYKWASVAVALNAVDPQSGQNIGAMVTSIALTNTPFVEGMESLVATKQNPKSGAAPAVAQVQAYRRTFYESASSIEDAICCMRELFGLPETAGIDGVMQQLMIVAGWFKTGAAPLGTDPDYIVGSLRTILNLPTLTPDAQVLDEAGKSVQMLVQQEMASAGTAMPEPTTDSGTVPPVPVTASTKGKPTMSATLLLTLATMLGVRESEDAVTSATKDLVQLRAGLQETFGLERDTTPILLGGAKELATAKTKLLNLFTALGIDDPDQAVAKVAQVMEASAKLKEVMPELEGLRVEKVKQEEAQAEADVDQAIAASKLPASVRPSFLLHRKADPKGFLEQHKLTGAPVAAPILSATQVTQLTSRVKIDQNGIAQIVPETGTVNLAGYAGANPTARAKTYLATVTPGWDKLTNEDQFMRAVTLRKQPNIIDAQV